MRTTFNILLVLIACFNSSCDGQPPLTLLANFVETPPPSIGSNDWYALNRSRYEIGVSMVNGNLEIRQANEVYRTEIFVAGGTLVGIDHGEWGGYLTFVPFDTTQKSIDIKSGNIKFLFSFNGKIYFIEGLAHMSISEGALYELDTMDNNFTYRKMLDFEDAPEAFSIYQDKIFVATHQNFYVVTDFVKTPLYTGIFWRGLYPNSIAVENDRNVYVGIRGGVVKLELVTRTLKFYKFK